MNCEGWFLICSTRQIRCHGWALIEATIGRSFGFKRGIDELITLYREILKDFHTRSEERIEFISPKLSTLPNTDSEPSASKSDMLEFDA